MAMDNVKQKYLICTDLDRTLLPNGKEPSSPQALPIFQTFVQHPEVVLAYVSGRSEQLLQKAITDFDIPMPDYAIGDVGTTIYEPANNWRSWDDWTEEIAKDWREKGWQDLRELFSDMGSLRLQESAKQNSYKLSYYTEVDTILAEVKTEMSRRLENIGVRASIIWSIDEEGKVGLLDILPKRATKVHAIHFLMEKGGYLPERTVFAGDSGNDLPVLTSGLNAVLVKNGHDDVRREALEIMAAQNMGSHLYLAKGDFLGMNGNYCAGVLEGIAHFLPETLKWMNSSE